MKAGSLRLALQTAVLAVALPFAAYADGDGTSTGGLQAKAAILHRLSRDRWPGLYRLVSHAAHRWPAA